MKNPNKAHHTELTAHEVRLLEELILKQIASNTGRKKWEATDQLKKLRKKYNL
jgi:hypothetical protein